MDNAAMLADYITWVQETRACNACRLCVPTVTPFLVNENITVVAPVRPPEERVVPLIGFLGRDYATQPCRLLILGMNPADTTETHPIFDLQAQIVDERTLHDAMDQIIRYFVEGRWNPLGGLKAYQRLSPQQFAYANQILCRTTMRASALSAAKNKPVLDAIYERCFEARVSRLIAILKPHLIVAVGDNTQVDAWPKRLRRLVEASDLTPRPDIAPVAFPLGMGLRTGPEAFAQAVSALNEQSATGGCSQ